MDLLTSISRSQILYIPAVFGGIWTAVIICIRTTRGNAPSAIRLILASLLSHFPSPQGTGAGIRASCCRHFGFAPNPLPLIRGNRNSTD